MSHHQAQACFQATETLFHCITSPKEEKAKINIAIKKKKKEISKWCGKNGGDIFNCGMICKFIILLCSWMLKVDWLTQNACDVYPFLPLILLGKMLDGIRASPTGKLSEESKVKYCSFSIFVSFYNIYNAGVIQRVKITFFVFVFVFELLFINGEKRKVPRFEILRIKRCFMWNRSRFEISRTWLLFDNSMLMLRILFFF